MDTVLLMFTRRMEACVAPTRYRQVNYQGGRGDTKEGTIKEDTETLKERGACRGEGPTRKLIVSPIRLLATQHSHSACVRTR